MLLFLLGILLSVLVYFKFVKPCNYWKEKGIKYARSWPAVGSMGKVLFKREAFVDVAFNLYYKHPDERYVGYMQFMQQCLLIRDVELIKRLTVKDFNHFTDHAFFGQGSDADPLLSKSLISLSGEKWKNMRATLSPAFTSSKMRNMFLLMEECAESFVSNFDQEVELEMKDVFGRFASNVIASTAFGIQIDCWKDKDNEFFKMGMLLSDFTFCQTIKFLFAQGFPKLGQLLRIEVMPHKATVFFRSIIKDNIQKREQEGIVRHDLIHILLEARKGKLKSDSSKEEKREGFATATEAEADPTAQDVELTDEHIVAQAMLFFFAGFDTLSTTASFMAHELAVNPEIQKRLQEEVDDVRRKHGNKFSYETVLGMKYLDQVVSETLRLWPAGFETDRLCTRDYVIQPVNPDEKSLIVKRGVDLVVPIMAIHRDPQFYLEPKRFDPERFNEQNRSKIMQGTYMPFGWGPRNCIGSRFALLELKILFCHFLSKLEFVPVSRTEIPIKLSTYTFSMQPQSGFWLGCKPRK